MTNYNKESRSNERYHYSVPVMVEDQGVIRRYSIKNISSGGMFIEVDRYSDYFIGQNLRIIFSLPGSDLELWVIAEVCHLCRLDTSKFGMGVKFIKFLLPEKKPQEINSL